MSFLQEIEPYYERIKLQQSGGGAIRNREIMVKIAEIHFKYIHSKDFKELADIGCGRCVGRMMNQLVGRYNEEIKNQGEKMTFPKQDKPCPTIDVNKLPWGKFKTYCKGKGLSVKGKSKKQLLKELGL